MPRRERRQRRGRRQRRVFPLSSFKDGFLNIMTKYLNQTELKHLIMAMSLYTIKRRQIINYAASLIIASRLHADTTTIRYFFFQYLYRIGNVATDRRCTGRRCTGRYRHTVPFHTGLVGNSFILRYSPIFREWFQRYHNERSLPDQVRIREILSRYIRYRGSTVDISDKKYIRDFNSFFKEKLFEIDLMNQDMGRVGIAFALLLYLDPAMHDSIITPSL